MKRFIFALLLIAIFAHADVKISQLPLGSAASTNVNDSFPYVNSVEAETERLLLSDLINLPAMVATYAPLTSPTFTGTVTAPTIVLSSGATVGYCWTATSSGGAGEWEACSSFSNPMTTLGDIIYGGSSGTPTRLAGNTSATKEFLTQTGTGSASAAPAWGALASGDIPNNAANTTGTASNITATSNSTLTSLSALTSASSLSTVGTIGTGTWEGTTVGISYGGTGQTTANAALNALLPDQSESSGYYLQTDGTNASWVAGSGGGSGVTTVGTFGSQSSSANGAVISGSDIYFQDFTPSNPGMAPASGGGTTNFLRADGSWAAPSGSSGITQLTGDVTAGPGSGSQAASLVATSNSTLTSLSALTSASSLSTVGTIGTGTWNGTEIGVGYGGTGLTSGTSGGIPYFSSGTTMASSGTLADGELIIGGGATAAPSSFSSGSAGQVLSLDGSDDLTWLSPPTSPTASSFAGWDANSNLSANGFGPAYATTATAGSTTTLTAASPQIEDFSGTDAQTIVLPVVSTLPQAGYPFVIGNNSTGLLTVESSGGNVISTVASGQTQTYRAVSLTGTTAASWEAPSALGYVAQAQLWAQVTISGCSWTQTNSGMVDFPATSGCTYTFTAGLPGNCSAPSTNIPGMHCASLGAGAYKMVYQGALGSQDGYTAQFQLYDGINFSPSAAICASADVGGLNVYCPGLDQTIVYASPQPNETLRFAAESANTSEPSLMGGGSFSVYYYPTQSQLAQTPNNSNGNWGGTSTQSGSTTSTTTTDPTSVSGSVTTTGTPQNISCTADATYLGIDCTLPQTGNYQVCFTGEFGNTTTGAVGYGFVTDGNNNSITGGQSGYATVASGGMPAGACGNYTATSTSVIFKIRGQASSNTADFSVSAWSVASLATSLTGAISPGSVTSSGSGQYHSEGAQLQINQTDSSVISQTGNWIAYSSYSSALTIFTFKNGEFSATPYCTCTVSYTGSLAGNMGLCQIQSLSSSGFSLLNSTVQNGGIVAEAYASTWYDDVVCIGSH